MCGLPAEGRRRRVAGPVLASLQPVELETPAGTARVHLRGPADAGVLLLLGHGAGGGVDTLDLRAARAAALGLGARVGLVEQPYRVAGRRVADRAATLDVAWLSVCAQVGAQVGAQLAAGVTLVTGGRSSGARVACRTATGSGAAGVLCLAFPLTPPGQPGAGRDDELAAPAVPVLVVQGDRDAFGLPADGPGRQVQVVPGADHAFRVPPAGRTAAEAARCTAELIERAVAGWLQTVT